MLNRTFYGSDSLGRKLVKIKSDKNCWIVKKGTQEYYDEVIDYEYSPFIYEETDTPITDKE